MIENVTPGSKFRPKAADENYIREAARAFHTQKRSQSFDEVNVISGKTITLSNESSVNLKRGQVVPLFDLTYERTTDSTASEDIAEMRANEATLRWNIERGRINFKLTNDHLDADNLGDNFCVPIGVVVGGDINSNYVGEVLIDGVFASHTIDYSRSGLTLIQTNRSFPYDDAGLYPDYIDFIDSYFDTEPRATD